MRKPMSEENIKRMPTNTPDHLSAGAIWTSIKLTDIVDIDQTQIREQYDEGVIDELKRLFNWQNPYGNDDNDKNYYPAELNEIDVVRCPQDEKKFWIIDGHHRYQAALATGKETIRAMIVNNSGNIKSLKVNDIDDLRFLQARENDDAVANRTRETKRRQIIAAMKKRPNWNLHQVAEYCNVSWQLAFAVHEELSASGEHKLTSPGKKVQEAVSKPENASKSNRELAKELDVSEGTVRKVRKNSKSKKYAPDAGKDAEKVGDCAGCLRLALRPYVVTSQNGERLRFCSESCAEEYASREGLIFDADSARFFDNEEDFRSADNLDKISQKAKTWLDDHDPQPRPTLNKATAETRRVVPDVEKPTSKVVKSGSIPLKDVDNIQQIVDDVCDWLGDRVAAFAVLFQDKRRRTEDE